MSPDRWLPEKSNTLVPVASNVRVSRKSDGTVPLNRFLASEAYQNLEVPRSVQNEEES